MENDKKPIEGFGDLTDEEIESSTIFSKPEIIDKKPPKKRKGKFYFVIKLLLAIAIIAAVCFGVYYIRFFIVPPQENKETTSSEAAEATRIQVTKNAFDNVKSVEVKNENGTFKFYSEKSNADSDQDSDSDKLWYIKGLEKEYTDTVYTSNTVSDCATFEVDGVYDGDASIDFSNPAAKIEVELVNGKNYNITISALKGEDSNLGGAYAKVSGDEKVYFIKKEFAEYYTYDMVHYIEFVAPTAIEKTDANSKYFGEGLESFDYIKLSGKDVRYEYRFEMNDNASGSIKYKMVAPYDFKVKNASLVNIVSLLKNDLDNTGIMGILHYDVGGLSEKTLKKYGLDEPSAIVEYKVADEVVTIRLRDIKFSEPESDEYEYAMVVNDCPVVFEVTKNSFDYFDWEPSDFASDAIVEEDVSEVSELTVSIDGKSYAFKTKTQTVTDEEGGEETTETKVSYDGKAIEYELFQKYFGYISSVKPFISNAMFEKPAKIEKYFEIKVKNVDAEVGETEVAVYKLADNESRYYIELNGNPAGFCQKAEADSVANNITKLIKNKEF